MYTSLDQGIFGPGEGHIRDTFMGSGQLLSCCYLIILGRLQGEGPMEGRLTPIALLYQAVFDNHLTYCTITPCQLCVCCVFLRTFHAVVLSHLVLVISRQHLVHGLSLHYMAIGPRYQIYSI